MLNPINHMRTTEDVERYRAEPYAVAADVYAHPMHVGRGGWTWYTGSAGWMYQAAIEGCSACAAGRDVQHQPVHPGDVAGYSLDWRVGATTYRRHRDESEPPGQRDRIGALDGEPIEHQAIPIEDDGAKHHVEIVIGRAGSPDARVAGTVVGAREFP